MTPNAPDRLPPALHRWVERDRSLAQAMHRATAHPSVRRFLMAISWLGDGVFKSPTVQEAEAYCRNFGAPMRFIDPKAAAGAPAGEVSYRCD